MKKTFIPATLVITAASLLVAGTFVNKAAANDDRDHSGRFEVQPGTLVLSRSVYTGDAATVKIGETLPPGCVAGNVTVPLIAGGSASVAVACAVATDRKSVV